MIKFLFIITMFLSPNARAVIGGIDTPRASVSTLELTIDHKIWSGAESAYITVKGTCSSVVVGTHPLTVLTASHCFRDVQLTEASLPQLRVNNLNGAKLVTLTHAIYTDVKKLRADDATDIAVLTFENSNGGDWNPIPIAYNASASNVFICGYGFSKNEGPSINPRCAFKQVISKSDSFELFLPTNYRELDFGLFNQFQAQFNSKTDWIDSIDKIIAVNRLVDGKYSRVEPMPREGDSGGPWFIRDEQGGLKLVALTSIIETFYRRNRRWPAFADAQDVPGEDLPYAAYGVRLDTPEAAFILARARALGADIP